MDSDSKMAIMATTEKIVEAMSQQEATIQNQQKLIEELQAHVQLLSPTEQPQQQRPQQQQKKMNLPFPDSFGGVSGDNARLWCAKVKLYADYYECSDEEAILLAMQRLKGSAEVWWHSFTLGNSDGNHTKKFDEFTAWYSRRSQQ